MIKVFAFHLRSMTTTYPLFEKCVENVEDEFWKKKFKQLSVNNFPKNCRYDEKRKRLIIYKSGKSNSISLPIDNLKEFYIVVKKILSEEFSMYSPIDLDKRRDDLVEMKEDLSIDYSEWKNIKPKSVKDHLIRTFVIDLGKSHNFNDSEISQLYSLVKVSMDFKIITQDNIVYKNQKILSIKNLRYKNGSGDKLGGKSGEAGGKNKGYFVVTNKSSPSRKPYKKVKKDEFGALLTKWKKSRN